MKVEKKKILILIGIVIVLGIIGVSFYFYKRAQDFKILVDTRDVSLVLWTGKGTVTAEDTCVIQDMYEIVKRDLNLEVIHVFPGKYLLITEREGKVKELEGDDYKDRERFYWDTVETHVYDVADGKEVQTIDLLKVVEENLQEYQCDRGSAIPALGKNGNAFVRWIVSDIPENGNQEKKTKYMFLDLETGKIYVEDGGPYTFLEDGGEKQEKFEDEMFHDGGWKDFKKENNLTELDDDEIMERAIDVYYSHGVSGDIPGVARIRITTDGLPKENEKLYERFPGLKEWQGKKGRVACIYLGGYPTGEEIRELFREE